MYRYRYRYVYLYLRSLFVLKLYEESQVHLVKSLGGIYIYIHTYIDVYRYRDIYT